MVADIQQTAKLSVQWSINSNDQDLRWINKQGSSEMRYRYLHQQVHLKHTITSQYLVSETAPYDGLPCSRGITRYNQLSLKAPSTKLLSMKQSDGKRLTLVRTFVRIALLKNTFPNP
ncbi:Hypothetical_protein [Hexamita inflata]|uniref:Hypothetical_protein n=1 Tax=Hexamita inflata TaxID=28002 RepID=A0AA86V438_9EUKA|nr:Hypothetical protein HINF_LOCUS63376 [Hexamita inflata]